MEAPLKAPASACPHPQPRTLPRTRSGRDAPLPGSPYPRSPNPAPRRRPRAAASLPARLSV